MTGDSGISISICVKPASVLTAAILLASCNPADPFHTGFGELEAARPYAARARTIEPPTPPTLVVMDWNVKFGGGRFDFFFDCHGDRTNMSEGEVLANMGAIAAKINQVNPDILVLQEVDVSSKRSAYIDQLQWILDHTEMNYGAYASQWKADYVPSDGIGRVDSGNAILSRWPIVEATRIALPLIGEDSAIEHYFYLKRNILKARVTLPDRELWVLGVHAEAYSHDGTKKRHIDRFKQELDAIAAKGELFVAAGDLNEIPPGSAQTRDFPDAVCDEDPRFDAEDYSAETTWLDDLYAAYEPEMTLGQYAADHSRWFSFTSDKNGFWNRKLDYIWTNGHFVEGSGLVHQSIGLGGLETMSRSDHAPVTVRWVVP